MKRSLVKVQNAQHLCACGGYKFKTIAKGHFYECRSCTEVGTHEKRNGRPITIAKVDRNTFKQKVKTILGFKN